jgi:hypothetical protein
MSAMDRPRLDSWKEIARYLDRDVRTVARWEEQRRLPVHRVPGGRRSNVFAYVDELDRWLASPGAEADAAAASTPADAAPRRNFSHARLTAAAALTAALLGAIAWAVTRSGESLQTVIVSGDELLARDGLGRTRWVHRLEGDAHVPVEQWSHVRDFNQDGRKEVLVTVNLAGPNADQQGAALLRLSEAGRLEWSRTLDDRVAFRGAEFGPPWAATGISPFYATGETRIAWIVHHFTWWPGLLVTMDDGGRRLGTFVNAGWIRAATASPHGRFLLLSGVNNGRGAYFFGVLDASHPAGRSPEPPGSETECVQCPEGDPLHYLVFPRTDVGREAPFPASGGPSIQAFPDGTIQVQTYESEAPEIATAIYQLSADFQLRGAAFNDAFWSRHARLEREGRLTHRADECPHRNGLEVERWTPAEGWHTVAIAAR